MAEGRRDPQAWNDKRPTAPTRTTRSSSTCSEREWGSNENRKNSTETEDFVFCSSHLIEKSYQVMFYDQVGDSSSQGWGAFWELERGGQQPLPALFNVCANTLQVLLLQSTTATKTKILLSILKANQLFCLSVRACVCVQCQEQGNWYYRHRIYLFFFFLKRLNWILIKNVFSLSKFNKKVVSYFLQSDPFFWHISYKRSLASKFFFKSTKVSYSQNTPKNFNVGLATTNKGRN